MKPTLKRLATCMAAMFGVTSCNVWGAPPASPPIQTQNPDPTASPSTTVPPVLEARPRVSLLPPETPEFPGIPWGSFLVFPELSQAATYDDNIYAERRNPSDDWVYTLSPSLALKSDWKRHALNFDIGGDFDQYHKHAQEDVNDYWLGFDGHYDLTGNTNVFGGARHSRDHEDRSTPGAVDPTAQIEPTRYDHEEAHLGIANASGAFRLRAGSTFDRYDYRDGVSRLGTSIDGDYRDHDLISLGARVGYVLSPKYEIFAQYSTDKREYDDLVANPFTGLPVIDPATGQTFNRNSDGYRAAAGLKFTPLPQRLTGEAFAGVMRQDFDYSAFSDVSKPYYGALVVWKPISQVTATGFVDRTLEETTVTDGTDYASSSIDTTAGFEVERRVTSKLSVNGRAAYTRSAFQSYDRLDKIIDAGAGLRYYVVPTVYLGADLRVIDRDSDALIAQYSENQALVSVGYTPARSRDYSIIPEQEAGAPEAPRPQGLYSGFYLGGQTGYGALTSATNGARGVGEGTDRANMGGFGESYGAFAGWGTEIRNWYLGVEIDGGDNSADWHHQKGKPDAPTEFVESESGYGASLRVGYLLEGGMLYGKAGMVETDFHTYFTENQYAPLGGAFDQAHTESGTRVGVGLEIPASRNVFVRTDYSHTDYEDYQAPHWISATGTTASETFDNHNDVFSLGVGWRFGAGGPEVAARPAAELNGLYAGASLGHAALGTELTGTHFDQGVGPIAFSGDFADTGFTGGFFAGYGHTWRQVYVGVEADAEAANFGWDHERVAGSGSGGRDFAAEKRGSYGGGLRIGYVLGNGSLLYGRVGAVRTRFNTIYNKGAGQAAWIDRSDRLEGSRFGLGAEIPASESAFVRMDYTYTRYDDTVDFVTTHEGGSNPDAMRFDNRESLARLGLGFRF